MISQVLRREIQHKLNNFAEKFSFTVPCGVEEPANQPPPPYGVEELLKQDLPPNVVK